MESQDLTNIRICLGKLDYLSCALKNLSCSNGSLSERDFRENVAEISRFLEGQMGCLQRNWPALLKVLTDKSQPQAE